jgi:hypothetical protein
MKTTARQLADRVWENRQGAWDHSDPTALMVATETLCPDDELAISEAVEEAGYKGSERAAMSKRVASMLIGSAQALADDMPTRGGD